MKRATAGKSPESKAGKARPGLAQTGHEARTQGLQQTGTEGEPPASGVASGTPEPVEHPADAYVVSLPASSNPKGPAFEGPLDLLLQIIQKHELDILDIPIGFITEKYLEYLKVMQSLTIDVASEYLVMAATLALIKSKMLLPDAPSDATEAGVEEEEEDPRAELVRRLLEYQKYKAAAEELGSRDTLGGGVFPRGTSEAKPTGPAPFAEFGVIDLLEAFSKILNKGETKVTHEVIFDRIGITERIVELTDLLKARGAVPFEEIFTREGKTPTRFDLVITFLAVLEMCKLRMMRVFQTEPLSPLHVDLVVVDDDEGEAHAAASPSPEEPDESYR